MNKEDAKPGMVVTMLDPVNVEEFCNVALVGVNPHTGKWVAACEDWTMKISEVEDDDWEYMDPVQEEMKL